MPGLEFRDVRKSFGAVQALRGVTFAVAETDAHALVGENGAGKSTLLKILAGILRPDSGRSAVAGSATPSRQPSRRPGARDRDGVSGDVELSEPHRDRQHLRRPGDRPGRTSARARDARTDRAACSSNCTFRSTPTPVPSRSRRPTGSCCRWRGRSRSIAASSSSTNPPPA